MTTHSPFEIRLALLRRGRRWWPAEFAFRGLGLMLLVGFWRLALVEHRLAIVPTLHPARLVDLGICAALIVMLCLGILLTMAGPVLLRDVPLPAYFTRPKARRR